MLCVLDAPGAKIGTDVGPGLTSAREEPFGKCEINPFLHQGVIGGSFVFERPLLSQKIISGCVQQKNQNLHRILHQNA